MRACACIIPYTPITHRLRLHGSVQRRTYTAYARIHACVHTYMHGYMYGARGQQGRLIAAVAAASLNARLHPIYGKADHDRARSVPRARI